MNGLPLLSATDQGEHDDDHHHHPQAQHAGVDVGGGGGDGDGDGCQHEEAQHDHPEDIRHPEPVGSVEAEELSCHPGITNHHIEVKGRTSTLPDRENLLHNIPLSALRNDALNKVSLKPPICYVVKLSYESHIKIISYLFDDLSLSLPFPRGS